MGTLGSMVKRRKQILSCLFHNSATAYSAS